MPRPKSILLRVAVDHAQKAHNCQHNQNHRLVRGDVRLKVWSDRSPDNYCAACALAMIERDIERLQSLAQEFRSEA